MPNGTSSVRQRGKRPKRRNDEKDGRTVQAADKIVVLADGRVAEQGAPAALMERGGLFRHMVELQQQSAGWRLG